MGKTESQLVAFQGRYAIASVWVHLFGVSYKGGGGAPLLSVGLSLYTNAKNFF